MDQQLYERCVYLSEKLIESICDSCGHCGNFPNDHICDDISIEQRMINLKHFMRLLSQRGVTRGDNPIHNIIINPESTDFDKIIGLPAKGEEIIFSKLTKKLIKPHTDYDGPSFISIVQCLILYYYNQINGTDFEQCCVCDDCMACVECQTRKMCHKCIPLEGRINNPNYGSCLTLCKYCIIDIEEHDQVYLRYVKISNDPMFHANIFMHIPELKKDIEYYEQRIAATIVPVDWILNMAKGLLIESEHTRDCSAFEERNEFRDIELEFWKGLAKLLSGVKYDAHDADSFSTDELAF